MMREKNSFEIRRTNDRRCRDVARHIVSGEQQTPRSQQMVKLAANQSSLLTPFTGRTTIDR